MSFSVPEEARREIEESGRTVEELATIEPEEEPAVAETRGAGRPTGSSACSFCGTEIVSIHTGYQRVRGWTRPRGAGGANQITVRELLDEWACRDCVDKLRRGVDPGQGSLL